jgi:hypothetical protein
LTSPVADVKLEGAVETEEIDTLKAPEMAHFADDVQIEYAA